MWLLSWGPAFLRGLEGLCWGRARFASTNTTLVQGQVFEDHPQLSKGLIPGLLKLGSDSTPLVPDAAGTVHQLFCSLLAPLEPVGPFLRQGCDVAGLAILPWSLSCSTCGGLRIYLLFFFHPIIF